MRNPFASPAATCRGATRAARRREKHENTAWQRANTRSWPFRLAIVERLEKAKKLIEDARKGAK